MIEKDLLKILCIYSAILGAILGLLPLIPLFIGFAFVVLLIFVSPIVLFYFKKLGLIKNFEMEKCLVVRAISGAVAGLGFSIVYFLIALLLQLIFKIQSFIWIKVLFVNIGFLIPMIILIALVVALFNAFSAFLVSYFFIYFNKNK